MTGQTRQPIEGLLAEAVDASRRTHLANERTLLAWWRTGLTAIAVGVGIGRIAPRLSGGVEDWTYAAVGIGFSVWGAMSIAYGTGRARAVKERLDEGHFLHAARWTTILAAIGLILGLATAILILVG